MRPSTTSSAWKLSTCGTVLGALLLVDVAALAQDVEEQHGALPGIEPVFLDRTKIRHIRQIHRFPLMFAPLSLRPAEADPRISDLQRRVRHIHRMTNLRYAERAAVGAWCRSGSHSRISGTVSGITRTASVAAITSRPIHRDRFRQCRLTLRKGDDRQFGDHQIHRADRGQRQIAPLHDLGFALRGCAAWRR